jgi:hypothetical protein
MPTLKQLDPPAQFKADEIGEPVIGVRILVKPGLDTLILCGDRNRVGTEILCSLLQARMELAGIRVTGADRGFPLNRAAFRFGVSKLVPALECIKSELEKQWLLSAAQIAWHDPRESTWRMWFPQSGRFELAAEDELAAERDFLASIASAMEKLQQSRNEFSGQ